MVARALTIAGSDSGGGAGVQADLKTFLAHRVYGASAITAITAQNTAGVRAWRPVEPELVAAQIGAVLEDIGANAVKVGMLGSAENVEAVAQELRRYNVARLVVDPVIASSSGTALLDSRGVRALCEQIFPLTLILTPNLPEAAALTGRRVDDPATMRRAAGELLARGPRYVLLKGGHLDGDPADLLLSAEEEIWLRSPRIATRHGHGTGCTYAAAIAAQLALGRPAAQAVALARRYLLAALENALDIGRGPGPLDHRAVPIGEEIL